MNDNAVRPDVLEAFHMMWNLHPAPVFLLQADRTILAVNEAAKALGIPVQSKCYALAGKDKPCSHCLANLALRDKRAKRSLGYSEEMGCFMDGYWTPVAGAEQYYIHYGNDISKCVREDLMKPGARCE